MREGARSASKERPLCWNCSMSPWMWPGDGVSWPHPGGYALFLNQPAMAGSYGRLTGQGAQRSGLGGGRG